MRVLFLANLFPPGYTGGAEVMNYHTCRGLTAEGIDCSLLVVNGRQPEAVDERYEHGGIPVHRVTFQTAGRAPAPWRIRRAWKDVFDGRVYRSVQAELRDRRPDLVHIHNVSGSSLAPYLACRAAGVPVVNTLHDLWLLCPNNMLYRRDGSFCDPGGRVGRSIGTGGRSSCGDCFRRYDFWADIPYRRSVFAFLTSNVRAFVSPSRALVGFHVRAGYDPGRFRVVPHGLRPNNHTQARHPGVRQAIVDRGRFPTLVFAGGGTEIKGAEVLLQAIPAMLAHVNRLRVLIAGGGEERLLARFREFAPHVSVLGWVPFQEMGHLFAAADLVAVPSTCAENFPLVALESLQVGTPVVGSDLGGIGEVIEVSAGREPANRATGYLFPVGDAAALAERVILHFAQPASIRRQMRQRCITRANTELTFEKHVQGTLRVYHEVLTG